MENAHVAIELQKHRFLFGTAVSAKVLERDDVPSERYRNFVAENFNAIVAENAMKWPQCEPAAGVNDFTEAERVAAFARKHQLQLRGHCIFWSKEKWQSDWVRALPSDALKPAMERRIGSILGKYRGIIRDWDMNNEMIHGGFFAGKLGPQIQPWVFQVSQQLAPEARFFTNEYSIIDNDANTEAYLEHIQSLIEAGAPVGGIGI